MADSTRATIEIAAPPGAVLDAIADFENYPIWAGGVRSATVLSEEGDGWADQVEFVLDAGPIKDTYVLDYDWNGVQADGTGAVTWSLVRAGILTVLDGRYQLRALGEGERTHVSYELTVDLRVPMLGMLKRKAETVIVGAALKELKKYLESGD